MTTPSGPAARPSSTPWGRPARPRPRLRGLAVALSLALSLLAAPLQAQPAAAEEGGTISGRVTFPAGVDPSRMAEVTILVIDPADGWSPFVHGVGADGSYSIESFPGTYAVQVRAPADLELAVEYYGNAYSLSRAQLVTVTEGRTTTGIDVQLDVGGSISGLVSGPAGPDGRWYVTARGAPDRGDHGVTPAPDGTYRISGLAPGDYTVQFNGPSVRFWQDAVRVEDATLVPVALGRASTLNPSLKHDAYLSASASPTVTTVGEPVEVLVSAVPRHGFGTVVSGTVEFVGSSGVLARAVLDDAGSARATITGLPAGHHAITARLVENATYYGSAAPEVVVSVGTSQPPVVTRVLPGGSAADAYVPEITILGSGFTRDATVRIGGIEFLYPTVHSPNQISLHGRAVPAGTHAVTVTTARGSSPAAPAATYTGWTAQPPPGFVSVEPVRVLDVHRVPAEQVGCVQVAGTKGIPSEATGVAVTVTSAAPTGPGHVVVFPDTAGDGSTAVPGTSTVNYEQGLDVANGTFLALPPSGRLCYVSRGAASTRIAIDVSGFTTSDSGFVLGTPDRLHDTRRTGVPAAPGTVTQVQVAGLAGVPVGAQSVIVNVTATEVGSPGNLRLFPSGTAIPGVSSLNFAPGRDKANTTVVRLSPEGRLSYFSDTAGPAHIILDVVGFVMAEPDYTPASARLLDTRAAGPQGLTPGRVLSVDLLRSTSPTGFTLPATATTALLNVVAVAPPMLGHLRVYPARSGDAPPGVSNLNYIPGRDVSNLVVVDLTAGHGVVDLYSENSPAHVVIDLVGYTTR